MSALEVTETDDADLAASEERILRGMMDSLAALDPAALTITRICTAARVIPHTVHYHFGNKDGRVVDSVIASAVKHELDHGERALGARLDALGAVVAMAVAGVGPRQTGPSG